MAKIFNAAEVQGHDQKDDIWMVIDSKVYDVSSFLEDHPGGEEVLMELAGLRILMQERMLPRPLRKLDIQRMQEMGEIDKATVQVEKKVHLKPVDDVKSPSPLLFIIPVLLAAGFAYYNMILKHQ